MSTLHLIIVVATAYLVVGAVVGLVHPGLFRSVLVDIRNAELLRGGVFWKPVMALVFFVLICVLWPVAWFKRRQSERRTAAQLERLRPFAQLYAAANRPVRYSGGDGSSFENAIVILDAYFGTGTTLRQYSSLGFLRSFTEAFNASTTVHILRGSVVPVVLAILGPLLPKDIKSFVPSALPSTLPIPTR